RRKTPWDKPLNCFIRPIVIICLLNCSLRAAEVVRVDSSQKSRLIVMADMGNEPDEEQQMAHLLMYANKVDIEGLIACSGKYLHADRKDGRTKTRADLFHKLVDAYAKTVDNLNLHETGWPEASYLRGVIKSGTAGYGIDAAKPGGANEASKLIESSVLKDDPRPLYVVCNAGANTLAQALNDLAETRSSQQMEELCKRLIVFENGAQDNSGAWIAGRYPAIAWHRSNHQTYSYGGPGKAEGPYTWEPFPRDPDGQNEWARMHIMEGHGALGAVFPPRVMNRKLHFIEGGGTIPWTGLVNHGLTDPQNLQWGGWSGRFSRQRHANILSRHADIRKDEQSYSKFLMFEADSETESWTDPMSGEVFEGRSVPVWRFRRAMFNDFQARMDWCVQSFDEANHNPIAAVRIEIDNVEREITESRDSIIRLSALPGQRVSFDASPSSDPDGDGFQTTWWIYREAGTHKGELAIDSSNASASLSIPTDAAGGEIHVILELVDESEIVPLHDYRRIVLNVTAEETDSDEVGQQ
ncbi:MAG: DUF1593 domain-containing protein, partial [Planctomycetota bacterium]